MGGTLGLYETCYSTGSQRVTFSDKEIVEFTLSILVDRWSLRGLAVIRDEDLRNAAAFNNVEGEQLALISDPMIVTRFRREIAKACYSHGHLSVVFCPCDLEESWHLLATNGYILENSGRICTGPSILEAVVTVEKRELLLRLSDIWKAGWMSYWHDAQYVVRWRPGDAAMLPGYARQDVA